MELLSVGLFGYQRFEEDSGEMDLTGSPVAIVGPNEAGKTSFLEALTYLNEDGPFADRARTRGYAGEIRVWARFALDAEDVAAIRDVGGSGSPVLIIVSKSSDNDEVSYKLEPPIERDLESRRRALAATIKVRSGKWIKDRTADDGTDVMLADLAEVLERQAETLTDSQLDGMGATVTHLRALDDAPPSVRKLADQVERLRETEAIPHPDTAAGRILLRRRPRFLIFDVGWRQLESEFAFPDGPSPAVRALFDLIETDLEALGVAVESADLTTVAELQVRANVEFAELFGGRWNQANIRVQIHVDGAVVHVYVRTASGRLIPMAERSAGLRQFIALLAFVEHERTDQERVILLVDEAETHLHYDAQADLVNVFTRQSVVEKIMYTTHSAGCLPLDLGTGVRVIEPVGPAGTPAEDWERSRIRNAFWTTGPGFSPLLLAMGASSFVFSAMRRALVGEGPTEVILLPTLLPEATGSPTLDFQIAPGVANVHPDDVLELSASAASLAYIVDGDEGGLGHRDKLIENGVAVDRILVLGQNTGEPLAIEDLVDAQLYCSAVNRVLVRHGRPEIPADEIGDVGRKAAVKTFCRAQNVEPPGEREVAQQILEMGLERRRAGDTTQILAEARRALVADMHEAITLLLS